MSEGMGSEGARTGKEEYEYRSDWNSCHYQSYWQFINKREHCDCNVGGRLGWGKHWGLRDRCYGACPRAGTRCVLNNCLWWKTDNSLNPKKEECMGWVADNKFTWLWRLGMIYLIIVKVAISSRDWDGVVIRKWSKGFQLRWYCFIYQAGWYVILYLLQIWNIS